MELVITYATDIKARVCWDMYECICELTGPILSKISTGLCFFFFSSSSLIFLGWSSQRMCCHVTLLKGVLGRKSENAHEVFNNFII